MKLEKLLEKIDELNENYQYVNIEIFERIIIDGIVTNYEISNLGRVYNSKRKKFLKPSKSTSTGHVRVNIYISGKEHWRTVHSLVAEYFCEYRDEKHMDEIHHIDCNPRNNVWWNLIYLSHKEHHLIHCYLNTYNLPTGDNSVSTKVPDKVVRSIFIDMSNGMKNKDIASKYNLYESYISLLRTGSIRKNIYKDFNITAKKVNRISGMYDQDKLDEAAQLIAKGLNNKEISKITGIARDTISLICSGKQHRDLYDKYKLNNVKPISKRNSDESLDLMVQLILENKLSLREISNKTGVPYASVNDARLKIRKGVYKRALKFK